MMNRWENFDEALDWIYSFTNLERDQDKRKDKKNFILYPIQKMNQYFSNPTDKFKIIHVAGSKGKGTVSYIIGKYFESLGYKVGLYTSPHLYDVCERIKINSQNINKEDFLSILERIYDYVAKIDKKEEIPSFFDIFTELAFIYFYEKKVEIAIIEVGLGGRLDSTNIVNPILSIITSITYEHTEVLGKTLPKIASEKAGIIKDKVPIILGKNRKIVYDRVKKIASKKDSDLYYSQDYLSVKTKGFIKSKLKIFSKYEIEIKDKLIEEFGKGILGKDTFIKDKKNYEIISQLIGCFQNENIETSICAILVASKLLKIDFIFEKLKEIMNEAYWPSRFEIINYKGKILILDGAHTEDSVKKLIRTIKKLIKEKYLNIEIAIITGMMKDKNHIGILKNLLKISKTFYFVELDKWKDSKVTNYLNKAIELADAKNIKITYFVQNGVDWKGKDIVDKILENKKDINTILITGSLYLAQYFKDF